MPHPRPTHELPEYPVRPRPTPRAVVPVWERWPLGSRLVAAGLAALVLAVVVGVLRGSPGTADEASGLVLDAGAAPTDGGMATAPTDTTVDPALLFEGTLPPTVASAPPTAAVARATALPSAVSTRPAAVAAAPSTAAAAKPAAATPTTAKAPVTTAKKSAATSAKAPATTKPAATTRAPTTAPKAVVKAPATTIATTVKPTTTTVAPKETWTTDEVQALIRATWPADSVDRALEVAYNESRYRSNAYNGGCCYGVFQINASAHAWRLKARGLGTADLFDAKVNIEIAIDIFQDSGWGPWGG